MAENSNATKKYLEIEDCYSIAYNYDRNKESHMMKNSEWRAMAYLTHSQYERKGARVSSTGNIYGMQAIAPFMLRGGRFDFESGSSIFYMGGTGETNYPDCSYRVVLSGF